MKKPRVEDVSQTLGEQFYSIQMKSNMLTSELNNNINNNNHFQVRETHTISLRPPPSLDKSIPSRLQTEASKYPPPPPSSRREEYITSENNRRTLGNATAALSADKYKC